jgi:hypothetical protein
MDKEIISIIFLSKTGSESSSLISSVNSEHNLGTLMSMTLELNLRMLVGPYTLKAPSMCPFRFQSLNGS